jgi:hypothetical protein
VWRDAWQGFADAETGNAGGQRMNTEQIARLEKLLNRTLSAEEKERLRRIQETLQISDNDVVWDILTAMEYHRTFYDELPQKITFASTEILRGITDAAEAEAQRTQGKLAESVVELAHKLAARINLTTLLPMGFCVLACLLVYGSLSMWAGYRIGSGEGHDLLWILRMPSGLLLGCLALASGMFLGIHTGREFAEGGCGWRKKALVALAMLIVGGVLFGLGV